MAMDTGLLLAALEQRKIKSSSMTVCIDLLDHTRRIIHEEADCMLLFCFVKTVRSRSKWWMCNDSQRGMIVAFATALTNGVRPEELHDVYSRCDEKASL